MNELEKIDELRKRMDVTYGQAKGALDACEGDLLRALIYLEGKGYAPTGSAAFSGADEYEPLWDKEKTENFVRGVIEQIKGYIQEVNVTKVRLVDSEKTLIEIPATVGVVGLGIMLFSPLLLVISAVGAATAIFKEMAIEVEKSDGTVERHNLKFPRFGSNKDGADTDEESCTADGAGDAGEAGLEDEDTK